MGWYVMKEWWSRKKERGKREKKRRNLEGNSFIDFILEVLFWIPELIILPFRLIFWLIRGLGRLISDIF